VGVVRVGSDTGGTFTDLVGPDGSLTKVPSTPGDPGAAVRSGLAAMGLGVTGGPGTGGPDAGEPDAGEFVLTHGTTVATNAVLERTGGPVALVATRGFADVIEIGRQDRPHLYDPSVRRSEPLVARPLRLEVGGRLAGDGTELEALDEGSLAGVRDTLVDLAGRGEVAAVAVCLLHADLNASHERRVAEVLRAAGLDVTCSHEISPEFREFERTSTTVVNAYLRPPCGAYLAGLAPGGSVSVMTSAGGLVPAAGAARFPARLLLSGPAGGVRAAAAVAAANGIAAAVSLDMGGTSTDVCCILEGVPVPAAERAVGHLPVRLPSLDVHTIGAGGGSIAAIDAGGALVVGPRSAGAVPGPACYGLGGSEPTVTDANLLTGRIPAGTSLPGLGVLDADAAAGAMDAAGVDPHGVLAVVNAGMEQALRSVTVERGVDPRELALVAFGGAGPLHACDLADALGIPEVLVPARAGVFSAVGVLTAPDQEDRVRSWPAPLDHSGLDDALAELAGDAVAALGDAGAGAGGPATVTTAVDCRYSGQSHELTVASVAAFATEHLARNGYERGDTPVEVVALRASARRDSPVDVSDLAVDATARLGSTRVRGPVVLAEADSTIWVAPGWVATPAAAGAIRLRREDR
jgi:N-methylhydantoinase A/oxoprolinase/acetone carboxylase beta subunit